MSAKTILYVEDNELNRKIVRDMLKRTTYSLIEAIDGEAGVAKAREAQPDLILMDIQLPKISGIEAMRLLRSETATATTPIVAITSFALSGDDQKARDAGATACTVPPLHNPCVDPRFDLVSPKGKAPTWNQMGNGNWATSTTYASSILKLYNEALAWS